jgi:hypothetical protein
MSCHPQISSLVAYGSEAEVKLVSILSALMGEPVVKTSGTFDAMDFQGATTFSELKRRSSDHHYTDAKIRTEGWLMPSSKVMKGWQALSEGKRVVFWYFWMRDKSLWSYEMSETDFSQPGSHFVPTNHYDTQNHVTIPQDQWVRASVDCSSLVFEEDLCWIE